MTAESDQSVHGPSELPGPIPVSARKDLAKDRSPNNRKRRKKRDNSDEDPNKPQSDQDAESEPLTGEDDQAHEVDYLA